MQDKIKNSYKNKQHLSDIDGVSVYVTTKAKSKHSLSFTYHIEYNGVKIRNIHHRVTGTGYDPDNWCNTISDVFPDIAPYTPKKIATTPKEKKFKMVDELLFKKSARIFQ